jgi:hypothetical protein
MTNWLTAIVSTAPVLTAVVIALVVLFVVVARPGRRDRRRAEFGALLDVTQSTDDERMWQELRAALDAVDAATRLAATAPPLHEVIPSWCDGMTTCARHHVESCTDRPCCSTCPTREDTR